MPPSSSPTPTRAARRPSVMWTPLCQGRPQQLQPPPVAAVSPSPGQWRPLPCVRASRRCQPGAPTAIAAVLPAARRAHLCATPRQPVALRMTQLRATPADGAASDAAPSSGSSGSGSSGSSGGSGNSSSSGSNKSSSSGGSAAADRIGLMNELTSFMAGFSEEELGRAFDNAAGAMQQLQQLPPGHLGERLQQKRQQQQQQQQRQQQQQQQAPKTPPTASAFVQRLLDKALETRGGGSGVGAGSGGGGQGGPDEFINYLKTQEGRGVLLGVLREQFTPDEAALLDTAFGPDWLRFGASQGGMDAGQLARLTALGAEDMGRVAAVMDKVMGMSRQMDAMVAEASAAKQQGQAAQGGAAQPQPQAPQRKPWGASLARPQRAAAAAASTPGGTAAASVSASSSSDGGRRAAPAAGRYSWEVSVMQRGPTEQLRRLLALTEHTVQQQQQQWGVPASQQFQMLLRLYQQMLRLEVASLQLQLHEAGQPPLPLLPDAPLLSAEQLQGATAAVNAELNWLVRQVADGDTAARSAFWFMHAVLDPSWSDDAWAAAAGGRAGGSSGGGGGGGRAGSSSSSGLARLEAVGMFLAACSNLEALRAWAGAVAEARPELMASKELQEVLSALDDDWFILPHRRSDALAAAQAAAAAAAAAEDGTEAAAVAAAAAAAAAAPGGAGSRGQEPAQPAPSAFGLHASMVDVARVRQLAALDAAEVWFLAEMEVSPDAEQTLLKWALHPSIGPKLAGGSAATWMQQLSLQEPLRGVYAQLRVAEYLSRAAAVAQQ